MRAVVLVALLFALLPGAAARADTLFAALGERAGIERIVDRATAAWLEDARIASTFDNINIGRFKRLLAQQLCPLSGGGCEYRGRDMHASHKGLRLDTRQFNALTEGLQDAMDREGVPFRTQLGLIALLAPMQRDVVTR